MRTWSSDRQQDQRSSGPTGSIRLVFSSMFGGFPSEPEMWTRLPRCVPCLTSNLSKIAHTIFKRARSISARSGPLFSGHIYTMVVRIRFVRECDNNSGLR